MKIAKPVTLQIYVDKADKHAFRNWCFRNDKTMSQELRRYIRNTLKQGNSQSESR